VDQSELIKRTIFWADRIRKWGIEWITGIYPSEMAFLLGACDLADVCSIVESGRGTHAYSTKILGEYSREKDVRVISLDLEPHSKHAFGKELEKYPRLKCASGDSFSKMPVILEDLQGGQWGPIALLIDGPKQHMANKLSSVACSLYNISVIAHHNCEKNTSFWDEFLMLYPKAVHHEDAMNGSEWLSFKEWEKGEVGKQQLNRPIDPSSLALSFVTKPPKPLSRFLRWKWKFIGFWSLWL